MEEEIWKDVADPIWGEIYRVSNLGRVKSSTRYVNSREGVKQLKKEKIMNGTLIDRYIRVTFRFEGKMKLMPMHRLVAQAFIPNPKNLPMVNHRDCNTSNNKVENLEWCDARHNTKHAYENNLMPWIQKQQKDSKGKLPPSAKIVLHTESGVFYESAKDAALSIGVNPRTLNSWLRGVRPNKSPFIYA